MIRGERGRLTIVNKNLKMIKREGIKKTFRKNKWL